MLEYFIKDIHKKSILVMLISFLYVLISALVNLLLFNNNKFTLLFLITILLIPLYNKTIKKLVNEVNKEKEIKYVFDVIKFSKLFLFLFIGLVFGFIVIINLFNYNDISIGINIKSSLTKFYMIVQNNLKVLFISLALAFVYGFGVLFILIWNSWIFANLLNNIINNNVNLLFVVIIYSVIELFAYLIGAYAGSIISYGFINKKKVNMNKLIIDSADLIILSIILILFAGLIEAFV